MESGVQCHLCKQTIPASQSFYEGHGVQVCLSCYKDASRCSLCRFPHVVKTIQGMGGICEFCKEQTLSNEASLQPILEPLGSFLKHYQHELKKDLQFQWVGWDALQKQQGSVPSQTSSTQFLDDFLQHCYPVWFCENQISFLAQMSRELLMPHLVGQLVAADLCSTYQLPHLLGDSPFLTLARGWCHWIAYNTAKLLKFSSTQKQLDRFPQALQGDFLKFQGMAEYREIKEVIEYAHTTLKEYSQKYL